MTCDGPLGDSTWSDPSLPYIAHYCVKKNLRLEGPCRSDGLTQAAQDPLGVSEEGQLGQDQQQLPKLPWPLCHKIIKDDRRSKDALEHHEVAPRERGRLKNRRRSELCRGAPSLDQITNLATPQRRI